MNHQGTDVNRLLAILLLGLALTGCGGGDPEPEEPQQTINPPACASDPKPCS